MTGERMMFRANRIKSSETNARSKDYLMLFHKELLKERESREEVKKDILLDECKRTIEAMRKCGYISNDNSTPMEDINRLGLDFYSRRRYPS